MTDAVLSPHMNPLTCGTSKWSACLAEQLGVPHVALDAHGHEYQRPLISARLTELPTKWLEPKQYDLFVHDWDNRWISVVQRATRVYAANAVIAEKVRSVRSDVTTVLCPPTIAGKADRGLFRVLTYGMAHKVVSEHFVDLKEKLEKAHPHYTVSLSTAVHEDSPWEQSLKESAETLRRIFGAKLRVLGYLADDALARELRECDCVALFYKPALRGNNTTAWAAMEAGKPLLTNTDEHTPVEMLHSVINLRAWPNFPAAHTLVEYGKSGQAASKAASWTRLLEWLRDDPPRVIVFDESGVGSGIGI